jgi:hypothetical protein
MRSDFSKEVAMVIVNETAVTQHLMWLLPSPARHGSCKKTATAAPLSLSLDRERDRKWTRKRNQKIHKLGE